MTTQLESFYDAALRTGHPDPLKMAETALRCRERTLKMKTEKRQMMVLSGPPPPTATSVPVAPKETKADGPKCTAHTLEGRKCTFKATIGCFCRKHFLMK